MNFPVLVEEITPAWLSHVLGAPVDEVAATPVGTGQIANCYRLTLTGSAVPESVIVKLPHVDPAFRAFVAGAYRTEARFYRDIACTVAVRVPACHHVDYAGTATSSCCSRISPPRSRATRSTAVMSTGRDAVLNLAGLHGPRWCDPTLTEDTCRDPRHRRGGRRACRELFGPATEQFVTASVHGSQSVRSRSLRAAPDLVATWIRARRSGSGSCTVTTVSTTCCSRPTAPPVPWPSTGRR